MSADIFAWVPERARFAAARVGLGLPANVEPCRRRGRVLGSTWIGEGRWCFVDSGSTEIPTDEEIPGFDEAGVVGDLIAVGGFGRVIPSSRSDQTVYLGRAVVSERYVSLVEALWPGAIWRSRGEREPVAAYSGRSPVSLIAPMAQSAPFDGPAIVGNVPPADAAKEQAERIAVLEREARLGNALRREIERLSAMGEGYASARELRRALALEGTEA